MSTRDSAMKIDSTEFGSITLYRTPYSPDTLIRLSGEVAKRRKNLSKKHYGISPIISAEEAEFIYEKGCATLVVGVGQYGNVTRSPQAAEFFKRHDCRVILRPKPHAIEISNRFSPNARSGSFGLYYLTC